MRNDGRMPNDNDRLAVLIDSDNTTAKLVTEILEELSKYGTPTVRRAYGDWGSPHLGGWRDVLNQHAIQPIQQIAYTKGKNATDSALIIDAMDLLYAGYVDAFAIVSSDSDFTRLATRLRESGKTVVGLGRRTTPVAFQSACDKFVFLDLLTEEEVLPSAPEQASTPPAPLPDLEKLLTSAINSASREDGWAALGAVGSHINRTHPSFDPRSYGFPKLVELARAQNYVDVEQAESGHARVRLRSSHPTRKAATKAPVKKGTPKKATAPGG